MGAKCCENRGILSRNHPGFFQCPDILQLDKPRIRSYNAFNRTRISHFKACARQCSTFYIYTARNACKSFLRRHEPVNVTLILSGHAPPADIRGTAETSPADRRGVKILISDLKIESFPKKKKIKS